LGSRINGSLARRAGRLAEHDTTKEAALHGAITGDKYDVIVIGGGIAGLYCADLLAQNEDGYRVLLLEATDRWGGRIETGSLYPGPYGPEPHRAEYGPMRFELELQPRLDGLLKRFGIEPVPFSPPVSPEPPATYPLAPRETDRYGTPLSSLELLKLGVFGLFGQETKVVDGSAPNNPAPFAPEVVLTDEKWLQNLSDENATFQRLRETALMPGTSRNLFEFGLWNALYTQLSPMATAKVLHFGTFYHLLPENPNAAEWAIFWLRIFKLGDKPLSTIKLGVDTVSIALESVLKESPRVDMRSESPVIAVRPDEGTTSVQVEIGDGTVYLADHAVFALPKEPLRALADGFPRTVRECIDAVIAFPLLKVFCVTKTPPWWTPLLPDAQAGAWNAPTREIHYLPARSKGDMSYRRPEQTLILLYTDRPALVYWQAYVVDKNWQTEAEVKQNDDLKQALVGVLFKLHFDWAKSNLVTMPGGPELDEFWTTIGKLKLAATGLLWKNILAGVDAHDPFFAELAREHPALVGYPALILFGSEEVLKWQYDAIGDYAIRDWSIPPYGAGCHVWAPSARSWDVRERLSAFGFDDDVRCLHVCGEAYSDYQGFIEGALRSTADAVATIVAGPQP
jgi:hypothetical protein